MAIVDAEYKMNGHSATGAEPENPPENTDQGDTERENNETLSPQEAAENAAIRTASAVQVTQEAAAQASREHPEKTNEINQAVEETRISMREHLERFKNKLFRPTIEEVKNLRGNDEVTELAKIWVRESGGPEAVRRMGGLEELNKLDYKGTKIDLTKDPNLKKLIQSKGEELVRQERFNKNVLKPKEREKKEPYDYSKLRYGPQTNTEITEALKTTNAEIKEKLTSIESINEQQSAQIESLKKQLEEQEAARKAEQEKFQQQLSEADAKRQAEIEKLKEQIAQERAESQESLADIVRAAVAEALQNQNGQVIEPEPTESPKEKRMREYMEAPRARKARMNAEQTKFSPNGNSPEVESITNEEQEDSPENVLNALTEVKNTIVANLNSEESKNELNRQFELMAGDFIDDVISLEKEFQDIPEVRTRIEFLKSELKYYQEVMANMESVARAGYAPAMYDTMAKELIKAIAQYKQLE